MIDVFVYRFLFSLLESIIFQRCIYCMIKNLNLREKRSGIWNGRIFQDESLVIFQDNREKY